MAPSSETVLLFDGDCGFCTTSVEWLRQHLPVMPMATPYQWADLELLQVDVADARRRVWLVTPTHHYGGHAAVSALLRHQPDPRWRFAGWLLVSPPFSPLAAAGYALIARFRHRLPGGTPACAVR
jgi:predicted DCC family thiol-disulfide oxidoreductase YuxK